MWKLIEAIGLAHQHAQQAERYLNAANGDLTLAASLFFDQTAEQQEADSEPDVDMAGDDDSNTNPRLSALLPRGCGEGDNSILPSLPADTLIATSRPTSPVCMPTCVNVCVQIET